MIETPQSQAIRDQVIPQLIQVGESLVIPPRFQGAHVVSNRSGLQPKLDRLTGLPILELEGEESIISDLSEAIREGQNFMYIHVDADNLKYANKSSKAFGDVCIELSAAKALKLLDRGLPHESKAKIVIVRPTHAADEVSIWIFGATDEETESIKKNLDGLESAKVDIKDPPFTFTTSYGLIDQDNPLIAKELEGARGWVAKDSGNKANRLYDRMTREAEHHAHFFKAVKDILAFPPIKELSNLTPPQFRDKIKDEWGDKRISTNVLGMIIELSFFRSALFLSTKLERQDIDTHYPFVNQLTQSIGELEKEGLISLDKLFEKVFV
ncbi:hypothetical protein HYW55_02545 [Candidatus Gottesmanbacteria bacterium]|nr:hypothetical protein [Candidatus Gottesmanbacteria bacterium]